MKNFGEQCRLDKEFTAQLVSNTGERPSKSAPVEP